MADSISFDDLIPKQSAVPSKGSSSSDISFDDLIPKQQRKEVGSTAHNIARTAAEGVAPALAGFAGAGAGMAAVSPVAAASLAVPVVGVPLSGLVEFGGAVGGAMGASWVARLAQNYAHEQLAPEDYRQRQIEKQQHPTSTFATELGTGLIGTSPKTVITAAKAGSKLGTMAASPTGQRVVSGGLQAGMEAGTEYASEGKIEPWKIAAAGAAGAAMPGLNVVGEKAFGAGQRLGKAVVPKKEAPTTTTTDLPPKPDETTTPEERAAALEAMKKRKAELDDKSKISEAVIRNKADPTDIERMGPKHDEQRKESLGLTKLSNEKIDKLMEPWKHLPQDQQDLIKQYIEAAHETSANEKFSRPEDWTPEESAAWDKGWEEFSKARGYSKQQIESFRKYRELSEKVRHLVGDDEAMGIEHELNQLHNEYSHEAGFLDERGNFLNREEALQRAIKTGQIHPDQELSVPHEGLHSGDLRAAGDERFQITEDQPASTPHKEAPKGTRGDFKDAIAANETKRMSLLDQAEEAARVGDEARVTSLNEQVKALEQEHEQLQKQMPPQEVTAYERGDVSEYADRHSEFTGSTKEAFIDWLHNSERPLDPKNIETYESEFMSDIESQPKLHKLEVLGDEAGSSQYGEEILTKSGDKIYLSTEASPESFSSLVRMEHGEPVSIVAKDASGKEVGRLTYMKDGGPIDVFVDPSSRRKGIGTALYDKHEQLGGKLPEGMALSKEAEALRSSRESPSKTNERLKAIAAEVRALDKSWKEKYDSGDKAGGDADLRKLAEKRAEMFDLQSKMDKAPRDESFTESGEKVVETPTEIKSEEDIPKFVEGLDPRTFVSSEEMTNYGAEILHKYGEEAALKFFDDWKLHQNEQTIPVPKNMEGLDDALHKSNTFTTKDLSEHVTNYKENTSKGVTQEMRETWFKAREGEITLPEAAKEFMDSILGGIDRENKALLARARKLGLDVGREYGESQSRHRIFAPKEGEEGSRWGRMVKEFFENKTPFGEHMAEEAQAAMERKVYQDSEGRVIEIHRQPKDVSIPMKDGTFKQVKKGTEIWEWKDGKKKQIGHVDSLEFGLGDKWMSKGKEITLTDGKVHEIEAHSPYRYVKDAEFSARMANMGLRKMVRDAELVESLKKSDLFKDVARGPETPIKEIPKGWRQPDNIDKIPQLRGWYFDPKTAAIIEDFARVWDNTAWMKMTNQIVKNLMLNPIPHIFNEVMHVYNARGFTGWVSPARLNMFKNSMRTAWRDVGQQSQFYRDIMREGGSVLGADPRNKLFDDLLKGATENEYGKQATEAGIKGLAKKFGTTVGEIYNGISSKSQQAMWFTRDVMYVGLVRETMARSEKRGKPMELSDAIKEVERHMPNYRIPSEVLGSRMLSKTLQNPNVALFSRYHYGMLKSLAETVKDIDPRNLRTQEGRQHFREGADTMMAIGFAMAALYPLMDAIAEGMFGEGAEQRRAGPYHVLYAAGEVAQGKKDFSYLLFPIFTFNPMLLSTLELGLNKNLFTGKPIYHPEDPLSDVASDVGTYAGKKIPQSAPLMQEGGGDVWLARQLDIKAKTQKQLDAEKRAEAYRERNRKNREKQRIEGTYKP